MLRKCLATVGALTALAWAGAARADQPASVPASVDAPAITLQGDGQADTDLVRGGGWHGGGGGHWHGGGGHWHGGGGHWHGGGWHGGGWGWGAGWRGGWGGWYGGYGGWYRPYYASYGYAYPYYSYPVYSYPYYSYYPCTYTYAPYAYAYYPVAGTADVVPNTPLNQQQYYMPPADYPQGSAPAQYQGQNGKSYQYDGGPGDPVPMPQQVPQPQKGAAPQQPLPGYPVSITGSIQNSGFTFPAYGQQAPAPASKTTTPASNFAYPAYGAQAKTSNFATGGAK